MEAMEKNKFNISKDESENREKIFGKRRTNELGKKKNNTQQDKMWKRDLSVSGTPN